MMTIYGDQLLYDHMTGKPGSATLTVMNDGHSYRLDLEDVPPVTTGDSDALEELGRGGGHGLAS